MNLQENIRRIQFLMGLNEITNPYSITWLEPTREYFIQELDELLGNDMRFSKDELDEKIKEVEGYIESAKRELTAYAVATPRDIIAEKNEEGYIQNPIDEVLRKVNEILEWMEDNYRDLNRLYQYQQYLEENPKVDINQFSDI